MDLLDYDDFRFWLVAKEPDEEVGKAYSADECPVASYLLETRDEEWFVAPINRGRTAWDAERLSMLGESIRVRPLPYWASAFACRVDREAVDEDHPITAKEALRYMDEVAHLAHVANKASQ